MNECKHDYPPHQCLFCIYEAKDQEIIELNEKLKASQARCAELEKELGRKKQKSLKDKK